MHDRLPKLVCSISGILESRTFSHFICNLAQETIYHRHTQFLYGHIMPPAISSAFKYKISLLIFGFYCLSPDMSLAQKAPEFNLGSDRGHVVLSRLQGRVIYLDFWASWCKPCRKSFPFMNELHARYGNQGLVVIAINLDEEKKNAETFLQTYPADFVIAYDMNGETPKEYGLTVMPSSWIIDKQGNIIRHDTGFKEADRDAIETTIRQTLASKR
jgi:cytochrome c biogenesis protein CcmG/thiol:disulfide interchange protein DsbE